MISISLNDVVQPFQGWGLLLVPFRGPHLLSAMDFISSHPRTSSMVIQMVPLRGNSINMFAITKQQPISQKC
jgi:hypothetical protein